MSEARCSGCGCWFPSEQGGCTFCGLDLPEPNRALRVARLNSATFDAAERAQAADDKYRQSYAEELRMAKRLGVEPAGPRGTPLTPELYRQLTPEHRRPGISE